MNTLLFIGEMDYSIYPDFDFIYTYLAGVFVITIACAVICFFLLCKIWGMCNDVRKILQILEQNKKRNETD